MPTTEAPEETQIDDAQADTDDTPAEDVVDPKDEPAGDTPAGESEDAEPEWSFADAMQEQGYEVGEDFDPKAGFEEISQQANAARFHQGQAEQFQQIISALQGQIAAAPPAAPTPQPEAEEKPTDPTFDLSYRDHIDPETNQFRPDTIAQFRDEQARHQKWQQEFQTDPIGTMKRAIRGMVEEVSGEVFDERSQKQQTSSSIDRFEQDNANWLYATDPNNNPIVNPINGQRQFSQYGQQFGKHFQMLIGEGMDQGAAANIAMKLLAGEVQQQQQPAPQPTAEETADSRANLKKAHTSRLTRGAGRTSGSGGTSDSASGPNSVPQNGKSTSFADTLRRNMAEAGIQDSDV